MKKALIILSSIALALGLLAVIVVFYPTGSYQTAVVPLSNGSPIASTTTFATATTTATSSQASATSTTPSSTATTIFTAPYPVSWQEGGQTFFITAASIASNQITFTLAIQMGNTSECVPLNLRLVSDESGTLKAPDSPNQPTFTFPDTQSCSGTPNALYSQPITFTLLPSVPSPFLFTTNGASNVFFEVATDTAGNIQITTPSHSG